MMPAYNPPGMDASQTATFNMPAELEAPGVTGSRGAAAYACSARDISGSRRFTPVDAWRMLRYMLRDMLHGMNRDGVKIVLDRTNYTCGACGLILMGDLREASEHASQEHGRQSFVFVERAPGGDDPGWGDVD